MNETKEKMCIDALFNICRELFGEDEFSVSGPKESAVCIERLSGRWAVYEKEKNSKNDMFLFDNVVEACLNFLQRLSTASDFGKNKNMFLDSIIMQKTA